jgi:transposase
VGVTAGARIVGAWERGRRGAKPSRLFLYDVTSTYLEGRCNAYGAFGYNRDRKRGQLRIVLGLLTDAEGFPVSVEVFQGNTQDPKTVSSQIRKLVERFNARDVTRVRNRGMLKSLQVEELAGEGFHYLTAITKPQIDTLLKRGVLQI